MLAKGNIRKIFGATIILAVFGFLFLMPLSFNGVTTVNADALKTAGDSLDKSLGGAQTELAKEIRLPILIGRFFQIVLGALGLIYMCVLVYGGYSWFTASGESEKVEKANKTLGNATWGFLIVLVAFTIVTFAVTNLTDAIITTTPPVK